MSAPLPTNDHQDGSELVPDRQQPAPADPWDKLPHWATFIFGALVGFLISFYWLIIRVIDAGSGRW